MNLSELWAEHCKETFPQGYGGKDVGGVCVTSIDSYVSGCVSSYLKHKEKSIDVELYQRLQKCGMEIEKVLLCTTGEANKYFSRLYEMYKLVVSSISVA
jgi:hypothetical protein